MRFVDSNLFDALQEYQDLKKLTITSDGEYGSEMSMRMHYLSDFRKKKIKVRIFFDKDKPIAWAWIFNYYRYSRSLAAFIYVDKNYRQMGIGTQLYSWLKDAGKSQRRKTTVFPWGKKSTAFYEKNKAKYKYRYV